jgi:hypothetical protein
VCEDRKPVVDANESISAGASKKVSQSMDTTLGELYLLESLKSFKGLKSTCEKAIARLDNERMHAVPADMSNSIVIIMKHMAGNMLSRWTDFLTTDGEKPGRNRDGEFIDDFNSREDLMVHWESGWACLFDALDILHPDNLLQVVTIRGEEHTVVRAISRQLTHYSYHTGQIVYVAKMLTGKDWKTLSIPLRGQ